MTYNFNLTYGLTKANLPLIPIHGLLGNKFFIEHGWVLDFDKMELSWQPNE